MMGNGSLASEDFARTISSDKHQTPSSPPPRTRTRTANAYHLVTHAALTTSRRSNQ